MSNNELNEDKDQPEKINHISLYTYAGIRNIASNKPPVVIDHIVDKYKEDYLKLLFESSKNNNIIP